VITIDGSMGEGGGQVLRSSLALSLATSTPLRISKIRAGRARPGLMRQHLVAVQAAATISDAEVSGAELGSTELSFRPRGVRVAPSYFVFPKHVSRESTAGAGAHSLASLSHSKETHSVLWLQSLPPMLIASLQTPSVASQ
jgi:RNA 3'-terminal phosphate cyclase